MPEERYACSEANAAQILNWLQTRDGILIWRSVNLSNPGASWTSPATNADGTPVTKPTWQADSEPERRITDPNEVDVYLAQEVKRFHVAVRMGGQGFSLKVSDGGTNRIRKEVRKAQEKYGKPAWYGFDYDDEKNAVIYIEGERLPILEWAARREVPV